MSLPNSVGAAAPPADRGKYYQSIAIIGVLFFIFGFLTWLNSTLIPFLKLACDLQTRTQALLVASAFYAAYFFLAIPSSSILQKTGFKKGMALGVLVMALGALMFIPAALSRNFNLFLVGLFIQAAGMALSQTAANPFISVVGPIESAAKRISIMGICNKLAGVVSPIILGAIILKGASVVEQRLQDTGDPELRNRLLEELAQRVIAPYLVFAASLAVLGLLIWLSPLPEIDTGDPEIAEPWTARVMGALRFPNLRLGVLCIFVYVGAEVMAADVVGPYGQDLGLSLDRTKNFGAYTLGSMVVGYILGIIAIPRFIKQETALALSAAVGLVFVSVAFFTHGYVSILFILLLGLANALMWPAIFPMGISGLGRFTKIGSALLIMGIVGGAALPPIYGLLVERAGLPPQSAFFWTTVPCYAYILYYAVRGHRRRA